MTVPELVAGQIVAGRFSIRRALGRTADTATWHAVTMPSRDVALRMFDPALAERLDVLDHLRRLTIETNALPPSVALRAIETAERALPSWRRLPAPERGKVGHGRHRGGYGISYRIRLLRGTAMASFLMDHGREGPPGLMGGAPGATNELVVCQGGVTTVPEHISKGEGYELHPGDWVQVRTPGGGGYGDAGERDPAQVRRDVARGYISAEEAQHWYPPATAAE